MNLKLLKDIEDFKMGSIVDVDDLTGKELLESKSATMEIEIPKVEEIVEKEFNKTINVIKGKNMKNENSEFIVGKAFAKIAGKAVTGMSEGTAGDGGNLVYTGIADLMGIAMAESKVYSKCMKIPLGDRQNAIKVPVDASDPFIKANAPVPTNPGEGADKTATKLAFGAQTLTLTKTVLYIPTTDELLQDVESLDAYIRAYAKSKLAGVLDYEILVGGGGGYDGITANSGYSTTVTVTSGAPTEAQTYGMVMAIDPRLYGNAEWFMSPGFWAATVGSMSTDKNIQKQNIDVVGMKLWGRPVTVMPCLNKKMILADLSKYAVAVPRIQDVMDVSEHVRFYNDETVFRLVHRGAGDCVWTARTAADGTVIGAFVESADV